MLIKSALRAIECYKEIKQADFIDDIEQGISIVVGEKRTEMLNFNYVIDTVYPDEDLFFVHESKGKIEVEYISDDNNEATFTKLDELQN